MPAPHKPPLGRNEGPANFVAGWNMPGYLPETQPEFFEDFDDAKRYVLNVMEEHSDQLWDEDLAEDLEAIRQDVNLESSAFTTDECAGLVYWVEVVK